MKSPHTFLGPTPHGVIRICAGGRLTAEQGVELSRIVRDLTSQKLSRNRCEYQPNQAPVSLLLHSAETAERLTATLMGWLLTVLVIDTRYAVVKQTFWKPGMKRAIHLFFAEGKQVVHLDAIEEALQHGTKRLRSFLNQVADSTLVVPPLQVDETAHEIMVSRLTVKERLIKRHNNRKAIGRFRGAGLR